VGFRRQSDIELRDLDDEDLVAYLVAARDAGEQAEVKKALEILVYGRMELVEAMCARKLPDHAVERVAEEAMIDTMEATFDGHSVGQFVNLLKTITARRIADHYGALGRRGHEELTLDDEDDEQRRRQVGRPDEELDAVPFRTVVDLVLDQLPEYHRVAVELAIFDGLSSADVAAEVNRRLPGLNDPMTSANVDQIKSRFRRTLRDELDDGDTG
jgi:RNA polymerase sigma factor (sigma-70 family)